jgi:hypothetical protein
VRERKRKGGNLPFQREKMRALKIHETSFMYLESLNTSPSDLFASEVSGASKWQGTLSCE